MKVLFLNPHIGSDHAVVKDLQAKGMAVLIAGNSQEAWQMLSLHGGNLDLLIIHREESETRDDENGFKVISKIKAAPQYAEIPMIVTSQKWGDAQFAKHQDTPQGANAYLKWPFDSKALYALISAVFGGAIPNSDASKISIKSEPAGGATRVDLSVPKSSPPKSGGKPLTPPKPSAAAKGKSSKSGSSSSSIPTATGELVLEDASNLFSRNEGQERSDTSIRLEMPEPDPEPAPAAASPPARPAAPPKSSVTAEVPSSIGIELEPTGGAGPVLEQSGPQDIPIAENSGLSLNALPSGKGSDALSQVLAQDASVEELLDAPAGTTVGLDSDDSDGRTTVQGFAPAPPRSRKPQRQVQQIQEEPEVSDSDAAQDMPYLFQGGQGGQGGRSAASAFARPLGDAVVPGGAAHAPDVETLKKYLLLREQDVAVLSSQLKSAKDQLKTIDEQLRMERGRNSELSHITGEQRRKLDDFEKDKQQALDTLQSEVTEVRFQLKAKTDKARILDAQVREAADEMERLKERVRADIRKIRVREKELENRLEIMKKDSEALISARENKIIELKRKLDLLEFNMDLLQDQHTREKENATKLRERLAKAAQVVRVAGGLLDNPAGASQLAAALAGASEGGDANSEDVA